MGGTVVGAAPRHRRICKSPRPSSRDLELASKGAGPLPLCPLLSSILPKSQRLLWEVGLMMPFERFSPTAKKVLTLAQDEAEKSHHSYIGTEHLLLGLLREGDGLAAKVLGNLGVEIDKVRTTIDSILGRNERIIVQQMIPTSRVQKVIEIAFEEAKRMNSQEVGTEHLLLGLLLEGEGIAAHVLEDLGANLERVRVEIARTRGDAPAAPTAPPDPQFEGLARLHEELHRGGGTLARPAAYWSGYTPLQPFSQLDHGVGWPMDLAVRSSICLAAEEGAAVAASEIGLEHLLVGLLRQGEGVAARAMTSLGVELAAVRQPARESAPSAAAAVHPQPLRLGQEATGALRDAVRISILEGRPSVDTGDVLLAVAEQLVAAVGRPELDTVAVHAAVARCRPDGVEH